MQEPVSPSPGRFGKSIWFLPRLMRFYRQDTPPAFLNIVSSGVRAATRASWSLFVPFMLPMNAYGVYSVYQTTVAAVTQLSVLGTPQIILREPKREIPLLGLFLHSLAIAAIVLVLSGITVIQHGWMFQSLVAASAISLILYTQMTMRAKSRLQFGRVLVSEATGGVIFVVAIAVIGISAWKMGKGWIDYRAMASAEILATVAIVASLLFRRGLRLTPRERSLQGTRSYLPAVYSVGIVVLFDVVIFRRLEVYFLERSPAGLQGVAVFGLAVQIFNLFLLAPSAIIEAWGPRFAGSFLEGRTEFVHTVRQKLRRYRQMYAAIVIGSVGMTPLLVTILFSKYEAWIWHITGFVAVRVVCSYAGFHSAYLYASRKERLLYLPAILGALVAIVSNFILTLRWGITGALEAYALTQLVVAGTTMVAARSSQITREGA